MTPKTLYRGWCEIRIEGPTHILEAVSDFLTSLGSGGAIFSPPAKPRLGHELLTGFLPNDRELNFNLSSLNAYLEGLRRLFPEQSLSRPKLQTIVDRDWLNQWRETIVPEKVSKKFWVVPEWLKAPPAALKPGTMVIRMEPGLAFGTGFHPTTKFCMEFIEALVPRKAGTVLDYGSGTAILAMAAAMLGAEKVVAIDIDPLSVRVAEENIARNKLRGKIQLMLGGRETFRRLTRFNFDLIVANLFANELTRLCDYIKKHLKPRGYLVMSGILPDQARSVLQFYRQAGFKLAKKKERKGWVALMMRKG